MNFAERKSMVPVKKCNSQLKSQGIELVGLEKELESAGLSVDDFYFDPNSPQSPYCYYRAAILMNFRSISHRASELKTIIDRVSRDINESVAKRDFDRFLSLVDDRLAPDLFMEVFNFVPDQNKYRLFDRIWRFNRNSHEVFTQEFIKKVSRYKGVTSNLPAADEKGWVRIYTVLDSAEFLPLQKLWTTDVNIAIVQALPLQPPTVYQGRVKLNNIVSYNNKTKRLDVQPNTVNQAEPMDLVNLVEFYPQLKMAGVIEQYKIYSRRIKTAWFHNPEGIHALSHTKRVLLLSLIIGCLEKYGQEDVHVLGLASIYHDIGRTNDGYDPDHGIASYNKVTNEQLPVLIDGEEQEILRFLIQNHAIPDQSAYKKFDRYGIKNIDRTIRLYNAFKDADGLDRVRIRDLNPEYLRTGSAQRLLLAAHQLYNERVVY
jgi:hypothetical protein